VWCPGSCGKLEVVTNAGSGWAPPETPSTAWAPPVGSPPQPSRLPGGGDYVSGMPLGGVRPPVPTDEAPSQRRELILTAILLVAAIAAGAASLMSWRDYGFLIGPSTEESGWVLPDGSMGRGWMAVVLGVVLAVAGVLVASDRLRAGRALAVLGGVGLLVLPVLEWGLGAGRARTGPGEGLWILLITGVVVVVAVGILGPAPEPPDGAVDQPSG